MAKYVERFCVNYGLFDNPTIPLKFYELRKIIDGTPQPVDSQAMEDYKKFLTNELHDDGTDPIDSPPPVGFSIISQGFAGLFYWAGKDEEYNVLHEIPYKYNSKIWEDGDFDDQGIGCAWYLDVVGIEKDMWKNMVLKPGTPPDVSDEDFQNNVKIYKETFIPDGLLSPDNITYDSKSVEEHLALLEGPIDIKNHTIIP